MIYHGENTQVKDLLPGLRILQTEDVLSCKSSAENYKGIIAVKRCSVENQKSTIAIDIVQW